MSQDSSEEEMTKEPLMEVGTELAEVLGASSSQSQVQTLEGMIDVGEIAEKANGSWDALRSLVAKLSSDKIKQYLSNHFHPSPTDNLHSHTVTKAGRMSKVSFQRQWLDRFSWLVYSPKLAGGMCRCCILFPQQPTRGERFRSTSGRSGILVLSPYQYPYSKALGKDGVLTCHEATFVHQHATEAMDLFLRSISNPSERVDSLLLRQKDELAEENRHILKQIILAVEFLAKQGLPFRGHRDDKIDFSEERINHGNFVAVLQLMAKNDPILTKHLNSAKRNAKYTSKSIQNQITHIYANKIREKLTYSLRESNLPYTVIADETTDHFSHVEVLTVCVRFVDISLPTTPHIKECFVYLQRANAAGISRKILDALTDPSVSLNPANIRGQAYDGASVMSSKVNGVQAKIRETSPRALYTHCYSHCLNLSIAASSEIQEVRNLVSLINEVYLFLSNSPKRESLFALTVKNFLPSSSHSKLPGLCKTRWVERHTCFEVFLEMYEAIATFLDAIVLPCDYPELASTDGSWNWDKETKTKAQGLKASLTSFPTVATFLIAKNVFDEAKSLAAKLQKRDQDVYEAFKMVDNVIKQLNKIRENIDKEFSEWYTEISQLADRVGVSECVPRKTSIQRNRSNVPSTTPQEHYKRSIAIPLLDCLIVQLKDRFHGDSRHTQSLLSLIPSVLISSKVQHLHHLDGLLFWDADLPCPKSLSSELRRWHTLWTDVEDSDTPQNFIQALASCDSDSFPNIYQLLLIGCTLPVTSAEAERTFSLLRRIKTFTRSTLTEEHFSDLAVIAMHYGVKIQPDVILKEFIEQHPRRIFVASVLND